MDPLCWSNFVPKIRNIRSVVSREMAVSKIRKISKRSRKLLFLVIFGPIQNGLPVLVKLCSQNQIDPLGGFQGNGGLQNKKNTKTFSETAFLVIFGPIQNGAPMLVQLRTENQIDPLGGFRGNVGSAM